MSWKVLEIQPTPNPNAMKFVLDRAISDRPESFFNAASAAGHPLALRLFAIDGVASVLLLGDFVTINKTPGSKWPAVSAGVKKALGE